MKFNKNSTATFLILFAAGVFPLHSFLQYSIMSISGETLNLYSVKIEHATCYMQQNIIKQKKVESTSNF